MASEKTNSRGNHLIRPSNLPLRLAAGAYIANAGVSLFSEGDRANDLHKQAAAAYPALESVKPEHFLRALAIGETAVGALLLAPRVSPRLAGLALTILSAGMLGPYVKDERYHRTVGSLRPNREGDGLAKDVWILGIGLALLSQRRRRPRPRPGD
ncbi:MAG TPA: hypothetical protein VGP46_04580 [Acidimicrobiales bacterium]|nr:hypothetical protein [Acidimicrobiales bacterium]